MSRIPWFKLIFVLGLGAMTFQAAGLLRADPPTTPRAADRARAERVVAVAAGTDERELPPPAAAASANGRVEPARPESRISGAAPGRIAKIVATEGQRVEAGTALVELDHTVEDAALAAAEADVAAASAELQRAVRGSRAEDIKAVSADAEIAKAKAELSRGIVGRLEKAGPDAVTGDELDRARRQAEADGAAARAADARARGVIAGSRREDIQLARARLAGAEARRAQAAAAIEKLIVRAPYAGEVLRVSARLGEYHTPGGEALLVLGDTSATRVRLELDERDVGAVAQGARVIVRSNAYPGVDFTGRVVEIGRQMGRKEVRSDDPDERVDTRVLEVVVAMDPPPRPLVIGLRVTGYLQR